LNRRPSELLGVDDPLQAYYFDLEILNAYYARNHVSKTVEKIMQKRAERRMRDLEYRRRYIG